MLVRVSIAAKLIGGCVKTLHRWEASGKLLPALRTKGGHRRYETSDLMELRGLVGGPPSHLTDETVSKGKTERVVGYVRVSSAKQREDLVRQPCQVETYAADHQWELDAIYKDIASGLNDKRSGLKRLIRAWATGHIDRVIITYDDRLARFGTHYWSGCSVPGGVKVERIQPVNLTLGLEQQLLDDLLALMTSFAGKYYHLCRGRFLSTPSI